MVFSFSPTALISFMAADYSDSWTNVVARTNIARRKILTKNLFFSCIETSFCPFSSILDSAFPVRTYKLGRLICQWHNYMANNCIDEYSIEGHVVLACVEDDLYRWIGPAYLSSRSR